MSWSADHDGYGRWIVGECTSASNRSSADDDVNGSKNCTPVGGCVVGVGRSVVEVVTGRVDVVVAATVLVVAGDAVVVGATVDEVVVLDGAGTVVGATVTDVGGSTVVLVVDVDGATSSHVDRSIVTTSPERVAAQRRPSVCAETTTLAVAAPMTAETATASQVRRIS